MNHFVKEGHDAYYDDVPRYKNPYKETEGSFLNWNTGWDEAEEHHRLFTDNQKLKAEKETLEIENASLKADIEFANEQVERFKEDAKNFATAFKYQCKNIDKIDELAHSLVGYINETNKLMFSRKKMISQLKLMFKPESP